MALISLDQVSKIYPRGSRPALDAISLDIERGEFVFLVGASGSGKTSLLRLLLHEEQATEGDIRVAGNDLRRMSNRQVPHYRRSIGFVFQDYKLLPNKTVWENVAFALEVIGAKRSTIKTLVPQVLETVGLTGKEDRRPQELSGGEQQRVAIARAYVNHPSLLLADEPTGNLDPTTSVGIMEVLEAINRTGTTIVMATHNEEIVNSMRKRVIELHNGKIVRDERQGSYDSTRYFPDAEVEAKAQRVIGVDHSLRKQVLADAHGETNDTKGSLPTCEQEVTGSVQAVAQAAQLVEQDEGIARLAQSVHTGRKGRYGEVFVSLEDTLTWGKGLKLDQLREGSGVADQEQSSAANNSDVQEDTEAKKTAKDTVDTAYTTGTAPSPTHSDAADAVASTDGTTTQSTSAVPSAPAEHAKFMPPAPPKAPSQREQHDASDHDGNSADRGVVQHSGDTKQHTPQEQHSEQDHEER